MRRGGGLHDGGRRPAQQTPTFVRDPKIAIDDEYTKKIKEYTTQPFFSSPLVDYLPASKTVPTPKAVLGDVAGAPGKLPYAEEVYQYMRMLEKASPRVKVYSIGKTEEGREMIAVAIASEAIMAKLQDNSARLAKLADPRTINMDDAQAEPLINASTPIYYITGTIHSPETGSPTALMELAYRLTVDDHQYIKSIRDNLITLITPVIEVDGRNKMVDIYKWHLAHPGQNWPGLVYWGKYVAHDNNRDAMGVTLKLTENVLNTYMQWHPQVLHDLHESVPYLYDNTVGDGPYNAWIDPILADEWQMIGWNNVSEMTKFGMPGVFTHGNFDTWSPGYLMFIAALHNGISRLYETFGNGGADTVERSLQPNDYARTWYKQNPPLPEGAVVAAEQQQLSADRAPHVAALLRREQAAVPAQLLHEEQAFDPEGAHRRTCGVRVHGRRPAPGRASRSAAHAAEAGRRDFARDGVVHRHGAGKEDAAARPTTTNDVGRMGRMGRKRWAGRATAGRIGGMGRRGRTRSRPPTTRTFPAGSYIVRMDQPYSRIADSLLDYQYWSPNDPQRTPYDDTGWTFPELYNVQAVRVTDVESARRAGRESQRRRSGPKAPSSDTGAIFLVNHNADIALATLRYKLKDASFEAAEEPFDAGGRKFSRGSFIIRNAGAADVQKAVGRSRSPDRRDRHRAVGEDPSDSRAARRDPPHVADHADRRVVAPGVRQRAGAVHLHQHAAGREGRQPQREVRRHRLPAGRPRHGRHRERHADVGQPAALEEDRRNAEPRIRGSNRRHASRTRMDGRRAPADVRAQAAVCC